ncbi:MAG TPA: hypothetical protein VLF69_06485 [Candidatus Saccharimonadales bacterium]|nr:hypothetical protein [Candidatus Saccharimonadales bacterium]
MKRHYLEEDLELIQKYFPGARQMRLRTPFDLTARGPQAGEGFRPTNTPRYGWTKETLWQH